MSLNAGTKAHIGVYSVWIDEGNPHNHAWWTKDGPITNQTMELAGVNAGLDLIGKISSLHHVDAKRFSVDIDGDNDAVPFARRSLDVHLECQTMSESGNAGTSKSSNSSNACTSSAPLPRFMEQSNIKNIIYSTSHYVINCMTKWLPRWERTGWITKQRRQVHNGVVLKHMADIAHANNVEFVRVPPELVNSDMVGVRNKSADKFDPMIINGMRSAREALMDAALDGNHSGCSKHKVKVTCEWAGG